MLLEKFVHAAKHNVLMDVKLTKVGQEVVRSFPEAELIGQSEWPFIKTNWTYICPTQCQARVYRRDGWDFGWPTLIRF